jgi:hypothetical protein
MDKSKLPAITKKSSETPWSPKHEKSRLKDRGGTIARNPDRAILPLPSQRYLKSWKLMDTMRIKKGF